LAGGCPQQQQQPRAGRAAPAAPCKAGLSPAGAPRRDPLRPPSRCPAAGPAAGPGPSCACSGGCIRGAPQPSHIQQPPRRVSVSLQRQSLTPSLPSLRQHIFVSLPSRFSSLQSSLLRFRFPLFPMADAPGDGPVRDARRPARHRCLARRCRDSGL